MWRIAEGSGEEPFLNIEYEPALEQIFDKFGADSVEEIEDQLLPDSHTVNKLRLGIIAGTNEDVAFYTEEELLATVEGISDELAAGLIDEQGDIPSLCERCRRTGDVFLGDLRHNADVEGQGWVEDLEAFIEEADDGHAFERRLKDAGIWVEPENVTAGH